MNNTLKQRNSSFELLRIIAMLFIIFHHFAVHGRFSFSPFDSSINRIWIDFISMFGKVGVNLFVLISGYFLIEKDGPLFNIKRILKLWGQVIFYALLILILFVIFDNTKITFISIYQRLTPLLSMEWWFASTYVVLFILYPFINILLRKIDQKTYQALLIVLIIIWSVIPTILNKPCEGNNLTWFITLYAIAGYIKLYGLNPKIKKQHYVLTFISIILLTILATIILIYLGEFDYHFVYYTTYLFKQNMLTILLISVSLFMIFVHTNIKTNKFINIVSSTTFGIYLIHDDRYIRPFLWERLFKNFTYQTSPWLIPYSICVCFGVFVICSVIDLIRLYTFEKSYLKFIDKYLDKILKPFKWLINKISNLFFGKNA